MQSTILGPADAVTIKTDYISTSLELKFYLEPGGKGGRRLEPLDHLWVCELDFSLFYKSGNRLRKTE